MHRGPTARIVPCWQETLVPSLSKQGFDGLADTATVYLFFRGDTVCHGIELLVTFRVRTKSILQCARDYRRHYSFKDRKGAT
jgi:hypothetical protein